jgi:hypothetical protein
MSDIVVTILFVGVLPASLLACVIAWTLPFMLMQHTPWAQKYYPKWLHKWINTLSR